MIGQIFGFLTVIASANPMPNGGGKTTAAWLCQCECGQTRIVAGVELKRRRIVSCSKQHGLSKTREYVSYNAMLSRCLYQQNKEFKNYGGRGIKVCDRWLNGERCQSGFQCFLSDMGRAPNGSTTVERNNVNGDYESSNCRWASWSEQARNKRNTRMIEVDGILRPLFKIAEEYGIKSSVLAARLDRYGFDMRRALTEPVKDTKFVRAPRER